MARRRFLLFYARVSRIDQEVEVSGVLLKHLKSLAREKVKIMCQGIPRCFHFTAAGFLWRPMTEETEEPTFPGEINDGDTSLWLEITGSRVKILSPVGQVMIGVAGEDQIDAM